MWKNLISSITSLAGGIYIYLIVAGLSAVIAGYGAYSWTSDYYEVKIEHANIMALKDKNDIQTKGDKLVAEYIQKIEQLGDRNASLQRQVSLAVKHSDGSSCVVSDGFVRLYNASAASEASTPSSSDGASSRVDEATLLEVITENNNKYNLLKAKLTKLQEFERINP
jgi:hypothetical protein